MSASEFESLSVNIVSNDAIMARLFSGTLKGAVFELFMKLLIVHIFCILFITLLHLSCNKSANFLVLNIYFAEDNNEEKEN